MAEYSTASLDLGRFDKNGVPQLDQSTGPDLTASNEMLAFATGLKGLGSSMANMQIDQKNEESRAENKKKYEATAAKQDKAIKENEATINAELYYRKFGGSKSWNELTREAKADVGISSEGTVQTTQLDTVKDTGILSQEEKDDTFLKEAYQLKRADALLVQEQHNWDKVAPTLVTNLFSEWQTQKQADPENVPEWVPYATVKLESYKTERYNKNFKGIPLLAKASSIRPPNDNIYLSGVAARQESYSKELQDNFIQTRIDDDKTYAQNTPEGITGLIESIYVANDGKNKMNVFSRERVVFQYIDTLDRDVLDATDPDAKVFDTIDAFRGANLKKGRAFFDRTGGVGKRWKAWYKAAVAKRNSLRSSAKTANAADLRQQKDRNIVNANKVEIAGRSALTYKAPTPSESNPKPQPRIIVLGSALRTLRTAERKNNYFSQGDKAKEFSALEAELVKAMKVENPNHIEYKPDPKESKPLKDFFKNKIAKLTKAEIEQLRVDLTLTPDVAWKEVLREELMDERETEITQSIANKKGELSISNSRSLVNKAAFVKESATERNRIKERLGLGIDELMGGITVNRKRTVKELRTLMKDVGSTKKLTEGDRTTLITQLEKRITTAVTEQNTIKDSTEFAKQFKALTTYEVQADGSYDVNDITSLQAAITSYTWTDKTKQNQLIQLLAAAKKGSNAVKNAKQKIKQENAYSTKMAGLLSPVKLQIKQLADSVSTEVITPDQAVKDFDKIKRDWIAKNSAFIEKGGSLANKIEYIDEFDKLRANILSSRTELQITNAKKDRVKNVRLNTEVRKVATSKLLAEVADVIDNPEKLRNEDLVFELEDKLRTASGPKLDDYGNSIDTTFLEPTAIEDQIGKLRTAQILDRDPKNIVSSAQVLITSADNISAIRELSGTEKIEKIKTSREFIMKALHNYELNPTHFKAERKYLDEVEKDGKIITKAAYRAGEEAIRLSFAQNLEKALSNERHLRGPGEATKLLNAISQKYLTLWGEQDALLNGQPDNIKLAKALEIANSLTTVHDNPKAHPLGEDMNQRLKEFRMDKKELRGFNYRKIRRGVSPTTKPNAVRFTPNGETLSDTEKELDAELAELTEVQEDLEEEKRSQNEQTVR